MFFESATEAPMEIRPLLLYYGMMAFAKAIVAGRGLRALSTLSQGHGLHDISDQTARLADLTVRIQGKGTFQYFNDVVAEQEGITYFENAMTRKHILQTAHSVQLDNMQLTLKDILARMAGLEDMFRATFREEASVLQFSVNPREGPEDLCELRVDVSELFHDLESLRQIVEGLRAKYPTLQRWGFSNAQLAWDKSLIVFKNVVPIENELTPEHADVLPEGRNVWSKSIVGEKYIDFRNLLDPVSGGSAQSSSSFMTPIRGAHISDISLQYVGMFLLSSLVRYRPQVWVHAVTRFASQERPADDQALALIERFMDTAQSRFQSIVPYLLSRH